MVVLAQNKINKIMINETDLNEILRTFQKVDETVEQKKTLASKTDTMILVGGSILAVLSVAILYSLSRNSPPPRRKF
jgi:tRNA A37 N6-isopentenylltransferase MiaA